MFADLFSGRLRYRALLLLVPVLLGLLLHRSHSILDSLIILMMTGLWLWHINRRTLHHRRPWLFSILFVAVAMYLSFTDASYQDIQRDALHFEKFMTDSSQSILRIASPPQRTRTQNKYTASYLMLKNDDWQKVKGKVFMYVPDSLALWDIGDLVYTSATPQLIPAPQNPYEFDFRSYAATHGITANIYISKNGIYHVGRSEIGLMARIKSGIRGYIIQQGQMHIAEESYPLYLALTLGDKTGMSTEVKQNFAKTGVLHLIALSGFHVLIVWLFICWPLRIIPDPKKREIIALVLLWLYAYLMGMTPSILRAVSVITVWKLAPYVGRRRDSVNTILFIAAVLLLIRPAWLVDVGFQLSFLATLSIIFFYPPIYQRLQTSYHYLNKVIAILAVSIAAQVLSLPISIYYFHQFPSTFLISNLVGSLVVTLLVPLNFIFLITAKIPLLGNTIGSIIHWLTQSFFGFIDWVSGYQWKWMSSLHIDYVLVICLYLFIISIAYWLLSGSRRYWIVSMLLLLTMGSYAIWSRHQLYRQPKLIIHHLNSGTVLQYIEQTYSVQILSRDISEFDWTSKVLPTLRSHYIPEYRCSADSIVDEQNCHLKIEGIDLLILSDDAEMTKPEKLDYLILRESPYIDLTEVYERYRPRLIVADGTCSSYRISDWKATADASQIPFYSTADSGAYIAYISDSTESD